MKRVLITIVLVLLVLSVPAQGEIILSTDLDDPVGNGTDWNSGTDSPALLTGGTPFTSWLGHNWDVNDDPEDLVAQYEASYINADGAYGGSGRGIINYWGFYADADDGSNGNHRTSQGGFFYAEPSMPDEFWFGYRFKMDPLMDDNEDWGFLKCVRFYAYEEGQPTWYHNVWDITWQSWMCGLQGTPWEWDDDPPDNPDGNEPPLYTSDPEEQCLKTLTTSSPGDHLARAIATGDFDEDTDLDLVIANTEHDYVGIMIGAGDGTFGAWGDVDDYSTGYGPVSVIVDDADDDGSLDVITANFWSDNISVLIGDGDGDFQTAVNYAVGDSPTFVAAGDFDEDNYQDLAVTNSLDDNVSVLINDGYGTFAAAVNYAVGDNPYSVAVADLDGADGPDLVVANTDDGDVSVLLNDGDGTFTLDADYAVGDNVHFVAIGDFDEDGDPDLAVTHYTEATNEVSVLIGDGDGTFGSAVTYTTGVGPMAIAIEDLDGDTHLDLIVANKIDDSVSVFMGVGDGTFASKADYDVGDGPLSVAAGDMNAGSDPDLAVANYLGQTISVLLGDGDGTFGAAADNDIWDPSNLPDCNDFFGGGENFYGCSNDYTDGGWHYVVLHAKQAVVDMELEVWIDGLEVDQTDWTPTWVGHEWGDYFGIGGNMQRQNDAYMEGYAGSWPNEMYTCYDDIIIATTKAEVLDFLDFSYERGSEQDITFTAHDASTALNEDDFYTLELYNLTSDPDCSGTALSTIQARTAVVADSNLSIDGNDYTYSWTVPEDLPLGDYYGIKITIEDAGANETEVYSIQGFAVITDDEDDFTKYPFWETTSGTADDHSQARCIVETANFIYACGQIEEEAVVWAMDLHTGEVAYSYTYDSNPRSILMWLEETTDGGVIACGACSVIGLGDDHDAVGEGLLVKLPRPGGSGEWTASFEEVYDTVDWVYGFSRVIETAEDEYVVCGQANDGTYLKRHGFLMQVPAPLDVPDTPDFATIYIHTEATQEAATSWIAAVEPTSEGFVAIGGGYEVEDGGDANGVAIARVGFTATVTEEGHSVTASDVFLIAGADVADYNGYWSVKADSVTEDTYAYTLLVDTPATPATGTITSEKADLYAGIWVSYHEDDDTGDLIEPPGIVIETDPDGDSTKATYEARGMSEARDELMLICGFETDGVVGVDPNSRDAFAWQIGEESDDDDGEFATYAYPGVTAQDHAGDAYQFVTGGSDAIFGYATVGATELKEWWLIELLDMRRIQHHTYGVDDEYDYGYCVIPADEDDPDAGYYLAGRKDEQFSVMFVKAYATEDDVAPDTVEVTVPTGDETEAGDGPWGGGDTEDITFTAMDNKYATEYSLDYSVNDGVGWTEIVGWTTLPVPDSYDDDTFTHEWEVADVATSEECIVRVTVRDEAENETEDESEVFTIADITPPAASLTSPNGGESWAAESTQDIVWDASDNVELSRFQLRYSTDGGSSWETDIEEWTDHDDAMFDEDPAGTFTYEWTLPDVNSADCIVLVSVRDAAGNVKYEWSAAAFTIGSGGDATSPTIEVTTPD